MSKTTEELVKPRVCRYLRKSRDDGQGETLEETFARHTRMTDAMVADRNYDIAHTYPEVVSGANIDERPQMRQLLQDLKDRKWDVVVVVDISRLSRGDGSDQTIITNAFKLTNTKCLSDYKLYDLSDPDDLELFERKLQNSRVEYKAITKRLNRGVYASIKEGYAAGGIHPYGLDCVGPKRKKVYQPNDDFENYKLAMEYCHDEAKPTFPGLQRYLHDHGIPSPNGKEWWSKPSLEYMIFNDVYIGINVWGIHKTEPYLGDDFKELKRKIISEDYIRVPAKWPAFIDPEYVFEARRKILPEPHIANNTVLTNPLAGLLRCSKCGYGILQRTVKRRRPKTYYVHENWKKDNDCTCKATPRDIVLNALVVALKETREASQFILTDSGNEARIKRLEKTRTQAEKSIEKSRKSLVDAYYRLDKGIIDESMYMTISELEKDKIARLETTLEDLQHQIANLDRDAVEQQVEHLDLMIETLEDKSLTPDQVNSILKLFIDHIDFTNNAPPRTSAHEIKLELYFR